MQSGILTVKLLYAHDLKNADVFGKQDPYCKLYVGKQTMRSRTHNGGGKNPVWNEIFRFNLVTENSLILELYDEDMLKDDSIGRATVDLAAVRSSKRLNTQVPVVRHKSGKQQGFVSLELLFEPAGATATAGSSAAVPAAVPMPYKPQEAGKPVQATATHHAPPPAAHSAYPAGPAPAPAPGVPVAGYSSQQPQGLPQGYPPAPPQGYPSYPSQPYPNQPYPNQAPPPGYPSGYPPAGYPPAGYPPAGYPPQGQYNYPPRPQQVHAVRPHRPHGGGGMGMGMGLLGGLAAGLLIGDLADGDLFDAGF